jgi:uncharacterized membrane protein
MTAQESGPRGGRRPVSGTGRRTSGTDPGTDKPRPPRRRTQPAEKSAARPQTARARLRQRDDQGDGAQDNRARDDNDRHANHRQPDQARQGREGAREERADQPQGEAEKQDEQGEHEQGKQDKKDKKDKKQGSGRVKSSHIIEEHTDVGLPRDTVYAQWTQYKEFSRFTKHESANQSEEGKQSGEGKQSDEGKQSGDGKQADEAKVTFESKIGPSRRKWDAEIVEQKPGRRIAWRSVGGAKNMGVVSFHAMDKNLTHLMVEMEYHPSGFFETIGNFFRMPRRRVRKDLKLFKNYIELKGEASGKGPGSIKGEGLKQQMDERASAARGK